MSQARPYITIAADTTYEVTIKKSRFICSLARVTNEAAAQAFISQITKEHRKATHNCFAYLLGDHDQIQRESDNGEPSGTAGVPILEALKLEHLHDVCAVVTRYFGGIKLGAGGLIRAYSNTTTGAIHQAGLIKRIKQTTLDITVPYPLYDQVNYYLNQAALTQTAPDYATAVTVHVFVDEDQVAAQIAALTTRFNNQLTIQKGTPRFHEVPLTNDEN